MCLPCCYGFRKDEDLLEQAQRDINSTNTTGFIRGFRTLKLLADGRDNLEASYTIGVLIRHFNHDTLTKMIFHLRSEDCSSFHVEYIGDKLCTFNIPITAAQKVAQIYLSRVVQHPDSRFCEDAQSKLDNVNEAIKNQLDAEVNRRKRAYIKANRPPPPERNSYQDVDELQRLINALRQTN